MIPMTRRLRVVMVLVVVVLVSVTGLTTARALSRAPAASATAGGLSVFVGYAEDKETITPDPADFPVPWNGAPNTTFLGASVPGQAACGTLATCYDTGAIRFDNPGPTPVTVTSVSVDDHSSLVGGKVFNNLWGSFTVPPGRSVILAANPPATDPGYDNFDTSGFPVSCTPLTVAPTVTVTIAGVATTLVDSTHVLDSGGTDAGSCSPKRNESIQWRPIGAPGSDDASLTLGPATLSAVAGTPATVTATLSDGSGTGLPNATVDFTVTSGPDAGVTGTGVTNGSGQASFTYTGLQGEDVVAASVTTVGSFSSAPAEVFWANGSSTGWTGADIGAAAPPGSQSFDPNSGTWAIAAGGSGPGGVADQFHFVSQALPGGGGVSARVTSLAGGSAAASAGVMVRSSTAVGSPYYAALVTPTGGVEVEYRTAVGGAAATVVGSTGTFPAHLWIAPSGSTMTTYTSPDGFTWTPLAGSQASISLGPGALGGMAVASGLQGTTGSATLGSVALTTSPPAPLPAVACPAPYACADIGSPTPAGSQSYDPNTGTWTVAGGGADIGGTSDQFRFVSAPLGGDGTVSARVATQANAGTQGKAGVMVRATTDPGSPEYSVLVTPGAGIKVQVRATQGGTTTKVANPAGAAPAYLRITRAGSTFTAATSPNGSTWTTIPGSATVLALPPAVLVGLAVTSHSSGQLSTVTMDSVTPAVTGTSPTTTTTTSTSTSTSTSTTTSTSTSTTSTTTTSTTTTSTTMPPPGCPSPFACGDIGSPALAGGQSYDPGTGTWTLTGGGTDITGTSDQFHFVSVPLVGDGSVRTEVASQTDSSSNAKAGVMLRTSSDPAAPEYSVLVSPGAGIKVQVRSTQGGTTAKLANPAGTAPSYLEVTRSGSTFTASTSTDGVLWTVIPGSSITLSFPPTLSAGLAVTSHNAGALSTVAFISVAIG